MRRGFCTLVLFIPTAELHTYTMGHSVKFPFFIAFSPFMVTATHSLYITIATVVALTHLFGHLSKVVDEGDGCTLLDWVVNLFYVLLQTHTVKEYYH